jgi:ubiquinone/menaquinone biosynthesis C-methylase UbiE
MPDHSVNYDQVAPTYNRRFAGQKDRPIATALFDLVHASRAGTVLEAGCGTGRWLADLLSGQVIEPGRLFGLDRSAGMLVQARGHQPGLLIVQGLAEALPFPDGSFDLIYCVNALHHFSQPRLFIQQAFRLLGPGGQLAIIGMDPRNFLPQANQPARAHWYVYEYFEGTLETDLVRFPSWGQVLDWMISAGFAFAQLQSVEHVRDSKTGSSVWSDPFLEKNSASQLILLTEEHYQQGLERMKAALSKAEAANQNLTFPVDLLIDMLVARKPDQRPL